MKTIGLEGRIRTAPQGCVWTLRPVALADMNLPGFDLHPLKGDRAGFWAVTVRGNRRVVFRFEDGDAVDVDYLDYH